MTAKSRSIAAKRLSPLAVLARMAAGTLATAIVLALLVHGSARAADAPAADTTDQVIVPQVERREVHKPKYPSNDFEIGLFGGSYTVQNFGTHFDWGARLGYDITEDFFVEASYRRTKASDKEFRNILPGGIFTAEQEKLQSYDLSLGWNFLPGEVFIGRNYAMASTMYAIAGLGSTKFDSQRMQTWNFGLGAKLFLADWVALRADVRDHIYTLDLLGKRSTTQNPELTVGFAFFF
ncbi:MAG TPA: outer membrane beta-barrel domain-containing protein [Burkholderiaceae bacterium]